MLEEQNKTNVESIFSKRLDELKIDYEKCTEQMDELNSISNEMTELSIHPRLKTILPLTEYAYVDATLINTEFLVKFGDYKSLASQTQMSNYIKGLIEEFRKQSEQYKMEIVQIEERLNVIKELNVECVEPFGDNKNVLIRKGEFVEILEFEDEPMSKERKSKFKNDAERDAYIKNFKKK